MDDEMISAEENVEKEEDLKKVAFQWVKTERSGDVCSFDRKEFSDGVEYVFFTDGSRIRSDLIGDVVMMIRDGENFYDLEANSVLSNPSSNPSGNSFSQKTEPIDPVKEILKKAKKINRKISLEIDLEMPTASMYHFMEENFEDVSTTLLENCMKQIDEKKIKASLKKQISLLYSSKQKMNEKNEFE